MPALVGHSGSGISLGALSHFATNDVALLLPATLSLLGTARILRSGGLGWYSVAAIGLGLAVATKYTAGIVLLPLLAAFVIDFRRNRRPGSHGDWACRGRIAGIVLPGHSIGLVNPAAFLDGIDRLTLYRVGNVKVGQTEEKWLALLPWVLTWGLGWVPPVSASLVASALLCGNGHWHGSYCRRPCSTCSSWEPRSVLRAAGRCRFPLPPPPRRLWGIRCRRRPRCPLARLAPNRHHCLR